MWTPTPPEMARAWPVAASSANWSALGVAVSTSRGTGPSSKARTVREMKGSVLRACNDSSNG